jgi:hypothetical protein
MDPFPRFYTIRITGSLHERWKDWFDGLAVTNLANGETLLQGLIQDQSQLVGVINQVHNLNLGLVSVTSEEKEEK